MSLRIKVAALFTISLVIGYLTGVYTTLHNTENSMEKAYAVAERAIENAAEVQGRLDSLCGDAVLKFIPCDSGLEVCICGDTNKYLKNLE